tara:strand:+ start:1001 stop:1384 length:384 start_codon:yes stop_codon:yes gene_type:complete
MKYLKQPEYIEKGVRYMMCQCGYQHVRVDEAATAVRCSREVNYQIAKMFPEEHKPKRSGRPAGWHFMSEFVDKDGTVFHKGVEQPDLKGTLKPTKVVKKQTKRRTKEQIQKEQILKYRKAKNKSINK